MPAHCSCTSLHAALSATLFLLHHLLRSCPRCAIHQPVLLLLSHQSAICPEQDEDASSRSGVGAATKYWWRNREQLPTRRVSDGRKFHGDHEDEDEVNDAALTLLWIVRGHVRH
jgi:hypothetical protein